MERMSVKLEQLPQRFKEHPFCPSARRTSQSVINELEVFMLNPFKDLGAGDRLCATERLVYRGEHS